MQQLLYCNDKNLLMSKGIGDNQQIQFQKAAGENAEVNEEIGKHLEGPSPSKFDKLSPSIA